jgi:hypothetical protein
VFDINWSCDGTIVAAGFEKSVVMLDMRKILSTPMDGQGAMNPTLSSLGPSGEGGSGQSMSYSGVTGQKQINRDQAKI